MNLDEYILLDAGLLIGALLNGDDRHSEARPIVEAAREGTIKGCTTVGILSEVYAALTWIGAQPPHKPAMAARSVRLLVEIPSAIRVLSDDLDVSLKMLELAESYKLTARRVHDARHAATALASGVLQVCTYDIADWNVFKPDGLVTIPPVSLSLIASRT